MKNLYISFFWLALAFCVVIFSIAFFRYAKAELLEDRPTDEYIWICGNHCWYDLRGKNLKEWKIEDHIKKEIAPKPVIKPVIKPVETNIPVTREFDLDKYAKAVARHETASCTKWYWKEYNNCFWMKNWRIAPCKKIGRNRMCIYETQEESYEAFKKVWKEWYWNKFPSYRAVQIYSGNDRANIWLANVTKFYEEQF